MRSVSHDSDETVAFHHQPLPQSPKSAEDVPLSPDAHLQQLFFLRGPAAIISPGPQTAALHAPALMSPMSSAGLHAPAIMSPTSVAAGPLLGPPPLAHAAVHAQDHAGRTWPRTPDAPIAARVVRAQYRSVDVRGGAEPALRALPPPPQRQRSGARPVRLSHALHGNSNEAPRRPSLPVSS